MGSLGGRLGLLPRTAGVFALTLAATVGREVSANFGDGESLFIGKVGGVADVGDEAPLGGDVGVVGVGVESSPEASTFTGD